jgi:hypothetical protein
MGAGQQKLSVPEIPGFHLHWMRGEPERLQQALQGGYEFVEEHETRQTSLSLGGDAKKSGNTDMGTRVSALAGAETGNDGQPLRLYLMKIKQEWHEEDLKTQEARSNHVREALIGGQDMKPNPGDTSNRYVGKSNTNMFQPKPIRRT